MHLDAAIPEDLLGTKVGNLEIVSLASTITRVRQSGRKEKKHTYNCLCSCGSTVQVCRGNLTTQHTLSCGCLKRRNAENNPGWKGHGRLSGYLWSHIKSHARRASRDLSFTLTMEQAWVQFEKQGGRCALTGWPLIIEHSSHKRSTRTASLDRIDSEKGYDPGNVQWVHKDVNQMKWSLTNTRFIEVCRAVVLHTAEEL